MFESLLNLDFDTTTSRWVLTLIGFILFMFLVARRNTLRKATAKFERRFRQMEQDQPEPLDTLDDDSLEAAWQKAKRMSTEPL